MDTIAIRTIRVLGKHGANFGERETEQPFEIDVTIGIDLARASESDTLEDTLDYDVLHKQIVSIVQNTSFELLERLAGEILTVIFRDARVRNAEVRIAKPGILARATPVVALVRENPTFRG